MRIEKLNSKSPSSRIENNSGCLPIPGRSIGVTSVERSIVYFRISVLVYTRIQVDARAARWQLAARSRAVDQRETICSRVMEILKSLLRHEKMRIDCWVVAAQIDSVKLPSHSARE